MDRELSEGFSIVLCTHNGVTRLEPTLTHLAALKIPEGNKVELIIVDNGSMDNTGTFVQNIWTELGEPFILKLISELRPGKGYAIETGYDAANYIYIVTVDDDNWLSSDYLLNVIELFKQDQKIGVLQGRSEGVFETPPPSWVEEFKEYFIIGSPLKEPGYFPKNNFFIWGAGMVIMKRDWLILRKAGFAALTSKIPGKAAGEDNETAIGMLLLGKRIYYSDKLKYKHFIPTTRAKWQKLKQNFEVAGYVNFYFFLYALVMDSYENNYSITNVMVRSKFRQYWFKRMRSFSWKQHLAYWVKPLNEYYQLRLILHYSEYKWFSKLSNNSMNDIAFLQNWILPMLKQHPGNFTWPLKKYWNLE